MSNSVEMTKELIRCRNTAEKLYIRQKCSEKYQTWSDIINVGLSPSSVGGFNYAIQKTVRVRTHGNRWNVPVDAFQSHRSTGNCSDYKKCNTQHSQTDRWSRRCYVCTSALVEKSDELCACTSGVEAVGRAMNRRKWEMASVRGYNRGFAHADMIPGEVRENPACLGIGGRDVKIVKQDPSGADVEWILR